MSNAHTKSTFFIVYLAALAAFPPFATDIYLASMPVLQHVFNTTAAHVQLTLSLFFLSFAIAQLIWGPLSDRIGRKPVVLYGALTFVAGSLACALSHSINMLIFARIVQAIGACAGSVMAFTIAKDTFAQSDEITKVLSTMMTITILAPLAAPIVGSYLLAHLGWQANFYFLFLYGALIFFSTTQLHETHPREQRKPLLLNKLFQAYKTQLACRPFFLASIAVSTNFATLFAFIASSSFIYINLYHLAPAHFGYFFAFNALFLVLGSLTLKKLKNRLASEHISAIGLTLTAIGSGLMFLLLYLLPKTIWATALPMLLISYGVGLLYSELMGLALKHVVEYNGLASSLLGTLRFVAGGAAGFITGIAVTTSAFPLAWVMLTLFLITLFSTVLYFKAQQK